MEMLVDPMLVCWVPGWVREQYERANPFFRSVLKRLESYHVSNNRVLLRRTKREMVKRHEAKVLRGKLNAADAEGKKKPGDLSGDSGQISDIHACESDDPDVIASRLLEVEADDKNKPVEMIWDPVPLTGGIDMLNGKETGGIGHERGQQSV